MVNFFDKSKNLEDKKNIAKIGAAHVKDGMTIGLGSGTTMAYFVEAVAERIKDEKLNVQFIPASKFIEKIAYDYKLKLVSIDQINEIDCAVDGADRIINKKILIKGGGGSLFREKKILLNAKNCLILADESKFTDIIDDFIVPVEIVPFGFTKTVRAIEEMGGYCFIRKNKEKILVTDNQNYIVDVKFSNVNDLVRVHKKLKLINGVVETGIFYNLEFEFITPSEKGW
ncbi:ribose 5-phosphate isomerase A [Lysinibacillus telephonicus]|uniref:ribose 5-phosphate isomerase A n=1 Tax=Lysinibacillus telephonicus TaxID=1714840 RepID=UPI0031FD8B0F